jgi:hypothetical protein
MGLPGIFSKPANPVKAMGYAVEVEVEVEVEGGGRDFR